MINIPITLQINAGPLEVIVHCTFLSEGADRWRSRRGGSGGGHGGALHTGSWRRWSIEWESGQLYHKPHDADLRSSVKYRLMLIQVMFFFFLLKVLLRNSKVQTTLSYPQLFQFRAAPLVSTWRLLRCQTFLFYGAGSNRGFGVQPIVPHRGGKARRRTCEPPCSPRAAVQHLPPSTYTLQRNSKVDVTVVPQRAATTCTVKKLMRHSYPLLSITRLIVSYVNEEYRVHHLPKKGYPGE